MSFLKDYQNLKEQSPVILNHGLKSENTDYTDYIYRSKNIYFGFYGGKNTDSAYIFNCQQVTDCFDCNHLVESELCWECTDSYGCYGCSYLDYCTSCTNCHFSYYLRHCQDCFGCVLLQHKSHCIFNVQYSPKEYRAVTRELFQKPAEEHFRRLAELKKKFPVPPSYQSKTENCDFGDYLYHSVNCYSCFDCLGSQNCLYSLELDRCQDCVDCSFLHECELCWECTGAGHSYNCSFIENGDYLRDCHFCSHCYKSEYLFGCVNLTHTKYCILNKQYSKEDFFKKVAQIKKELGWK